MSSATTLSDAARSEVRRIVLVSRIAGGMVAAALATAAVYIHRSDLRSADAVFGYFIVATGLAAFVTISTLSRIGHVRVLERSLHEVGSLTEQLRGMAERDPLTGLYNLPSFHDLLAAEIENARQAGAQVSLVVADLDNFKVLNDSYGHQFGDDVLRMTGASLRRVPGTPVRRRGSAGTSLRCCCPGRPEMPQSGSPERSSRGCARRAWTHASRT